jgi:hypothetical protein
MPAMIVDDYAGLTEKMLYDFINNELNTKKKDKLNPEYWRGLINEKN